MYGVKKTKIICSVGPVSDSVEIMSEMVKNGMDCARINLSHATEESMLTSNKATTADLAQPNIWIQRKEGLANVLRDTDYISFTYETPDVVDVSDLLYNGLPFGGAYTIATTRFTIGKELTATNHSLSLRFVFNPKTLDESGSPQIHFIDSYSETGFAWIKPNNTYIYKADGSYKSSGYTIS